MKVTSEIEEEVVRQRLAGRSIRETARKTGVSDWTVKKIWKERKPEEEPEEEGQRAARVVKLPLNPRLVLVRVDGIEGISRVIVKPDMRKRLTVGTVIRRVEKINGDLWRMVGV